MTDTIPSAPRIQRREVWVDLPAEYAGFRARVWVNAPSGVWVEINSGDEARAKAAASRVIIQHNGWIDENGDPFPNEINDEFWARIPTELAGVIFTAVQLEMQKLPNSMRPRKQR